MGISLFLLGAYISIDYYFKGKASESWPDTMGIVVDTDIFTIWTSGVGGGTEYEVYIKYQYSVGEKTFSNTTASFSDPKKTFMKREDAKAYRRLFPIGRKVAVHYDPTDPAVSCRERGADNIVTTAIYFLLSTGCAGLCFFCLRVLSAPRGDLY